MPNQYGVSKTKAVSASEAVSIFYSFTNDEFLRRTYKFQVILVESTALNDPIAYN
jgi:hypothetical protein